MLIDNLRKIKKLNIETLHDKREFGNIMNNLFVNSMNVVSDSYKVYSSYGTGLIAEIWWCGIFDKPFYKRFYNIDNPGAMHGYYLVYLFNKEKNKLYLSINQGAEKLSNNRKLANKISTINSTLRKQLSKKDNYIYDLSGYLTKDKNTRARGYEIGSIAAIEYDLEKDIEDKTFIDDLSLMLNDLRKITEFIENPPQDCNIFFKDRSIIDNTNQNIDFDEATESDEYVSNVNKEKLNISDDEAKKIGNRKIQYNDTLKSNRPKTDPRLGKYVLEKNNRQCQVDKRHITFSTPNNNIYAECHHLVPLKYQKEFKDNYNLDRIENIVCLCPVCHAAIHYGNNLEKAKRLEKLLAISPMKEKIKKEFNITTLEEFINKFY